MTLPAIVIAACNRDKSLKRLLNSIANADIPRGTELIISIDQSSNRKITRVANKFKWNLGDKKVIKQKKNLGIKEHMFLCLRRTKKHKSIVLLEEDCFVAPDFYLYALKTMHFFNDEEKVAGISLFNFLFNENVSMPFYPIEDGYDIYFLQQASSRGLLLTEQNWNDFSKWYQGYNKAETEKFLPRAVRNWNEHSWKKIFNQYLIATDKYFVFPRTGFVTNFGDKGNNVDGLRNRYMFQSPIPVKSSHNPNLPLFSSSLAVYDAFFELIPEKLKKLNPSLKDYDFTVDLNGSKDKDQVQTELMLTIRKANESLETFDSSLKPLPLNVIFKLKGTGINLTYTKKVDFNESFNWRYWQYTYYFPDSALKELLQFKIYEIINRFRKNRLPKK